MNVSHLACSRCDATFDHRRPHTTCVRCDSPLLVEYAFDELPSKDALAARAPTMWRYRELLPVEGDPVSLGEGLTPLLEIAPGVFVKDEGLNPTGTFKARGAACGISRAKELGVTHVALPTAGNAGGAWAAYGAAAGITVHVAMPKDAPQANIDECRLYGADLTLVDGLISDAAASIKDSISDHGWFDAATLREPYRIEGKKTLGLEIAEQLGWTMPDAIVYPAGGGVGIIAIYRALLQLLDIGWVSGDLPRLVVAQAAGCAPIVKAFSEGDIESQFWESASTIASGLRVPKAFGDFLVLEAIRETGGTAIAVSDIDILGAMAVLARTYGISAAPEGAAAFAAAEKLISDGVLSGRVVVINTGSSAKYAEAVAMAQR